MEQTPPTTIDQALQLAVQHHQTGRLREAEHLYRQILAQQPQNPNAWHLLGMIALQIGQPDTALEMYRKAIDLSPETPEFHDSLGKALHEKAQFDQAIAAYHQALELNPNFAGAHNHLGNALFKQEKLDEAIAAFRRSLELNPSYPEAHNSLAAALTTKGLIDDAIAEYHLALSLRPNYIEARTNLAHLLRQQGRLDEATASYGRLVALKPRDAVAHKLFADCLADGRNFDDAIAVYRKALTINPKSAEVYCNLGIALDNQRKFDRAAVADKNTENIARNQAIFDETVAAFSKAIELRPRWPTPLLHLGQLFHDQSRFEEARSIFQQAIQCEPNNSEALSRLAITLAELQRFEEAMNILNRAAALAPDSALTHETRGKILRRSGQGAEAINSFRRALEIAPESISSWMNLAHALQQNGRFDEVADCVRQILIREPGAVQAHFLMAAAGASADAAEMARITASLDDPHISIRDRASLGFVLGKMLDEADRFDEAFAQYAQANSLVLQIRQAAGERYSSDLFARQIDNTIAIWTPDLIARLRDRSEPSELPVFIVGMPRSGTSLVEQVAASHPDVFGAGELGDIGNLAASLNSTQFDPASISDAARKQLDRLRFLGGPASRVIDKTPINVEHLGLIATLFPQARIILCRRDPRDTCLSCFFQHFKAGNLFSFDLKLCGQHHVQTDRLIAHWLKVLPSPLLEVQYEDLVADLEAQSRRIINFLDLPWNPACLDFHRTERTVQTASSWQVRQPIYTRSVGRWRNYERHLEPLFEALGAGDNQDVPRNS